MTLLACEMIKSVLANSYNDDNDAECILLLGAGIMLQFNHNGLSRRHVRPTTNRANEVPDT